MKPWLPLLLKSNMANTMEHRDSNIETNLDGSYTPFDTLVNKKKGAVAIVGSGPSLKGNWHELEEFKGDIMACNAAYQFLLEKGITPAYMMCFDADPLMLEFITPHPEITFLLASRCPPKAFEMLKGCKIVMWHAAGDENIEKILERRKRCEAMVTGGSAAVVRALHLAHAMGYRDLHLYGADSSHINNDTHIRKSTTVERQMQVMVNKRVFLCSPWMTQQAEDFKVLVPSLLRNGTGIHVHGDGLIPHIAKSLGCRTDYESATRQWVREVKWKAKTLWTHL